MEKIGKYKHGIPYNEKHGGSCAEFKKINNISKCCQTEDADCYMIHYDTRCYCDSVCMVDTTDCCEDVKMSCFESQTVYTITETTETKDTEIIYDYLISTEFPEEILAVSEN